MTSPATFVLDGLVGVMLFETLDLLRMQPIRAEAADACLSIEQLNSTMLAELEKDPAFIPSEFWRDINQKNVQMLMSEGLDNFKRTISHNYYSWLILNPLTAHFRYVFKDWLIHPSLWPLRTKIETDVMVRTTTRTDRMALSAHQRFLYRTYVSCVWEKMLRSDCAGLAAKVSEPELGNPIHIWRNGRLITQDLANSILEANVIEKFLATADSHPRVAELGAGSGRLAHVFAATQTGTYHIFDIPPALAVSQWYLKRILPERRIFAFRPFDTFEEIEHELASCDIAFFTANQLAKFPAEYFDMIVSISTLPEARPDQVKMFLQLFQNLSRRFIYLKQWHAWTNPLDGTFMRTDDYVFDCCWTVALDQQDPVNPLFFNRVWAPTADVPALLPNKEPISEPQRLS